MKNLHVNLGSTTKEEIKNKNKKLPGRPSMEKTPGNRHHGGLAARGTGEGGAEWDTGYMDKLPGLNWR